MEFFTRDFMLMLSICSKIAGYLFLLDMSLILERLRMMFMANGKREMTT